MNRALCLHGAPASGGRKGGAFFARAHRGCDCSPNAAERNIVRGPSTALGSTAVDKEYLSPRCAQDDGILLSGLRRVVRGFICSLDLASRRDYFPRPVRGGRGLPLRSRAHRGFTLLEMIIVLVIMAILAGAALPAFSSAVNEHRVREDGHQLAMMVREGMIKSAEQHRPIIMDLTKNSMRLYAQGEQGNVDADADAKLFHDSGSTDTNSDNPLEETVSQPSLDQSQTLDSPNKLQIPDPAKADAWINMPDAGQEWVFQPGQLCPAGKIRVVRGDAYLELDFAALTGTVETEKYYFP